MAYFVIIRGPAGSGKTTIAERLAKRINGVHISIDEVLREHKLDIVEGESISEQNFIKANDIAIPQAAKSLDEGKAVVFDGNFYHRSQLGHLMKNLPYQKFTFAIKASLQECIDRDSRRTGTSKIGEESVRAVFKLVSRFDYGIGIDTSGKTEEEVIEEILKHLP